MVHLLTKVAEYAIIVNEKNEFLIVQWKEEHDYKWHFPGGRLDEGEREIEGLRREIKEELGIELTDIRPIYAKYIGKEYCYKKCDEPRYALFYLAKMKKGSEIKLNKQELNNYKWHKKEDIDRIDFWMPFYGEMLKNILNK